MGAPARIAPARRGCRVHGSICPCASVHDSQTANAWFAAKGCDRPTRVEPSRDDPLATAWEQIYSLAMPLVPGWEALPIADEIARKIGAQPVSELERGHRRAHNLGSLK